MPQIFNVLRCFKCLVFQVHQCKKSNKWECKMCGEKQSIKRYYGIGNGKECRGHVQRLNGIQGKINEQGDDARTSDCDEDENEKFNSKQVKKRISLPRKESKWKEYEDITENEPDIMYLDDEEIAKKKPRMRYDKKPSDKKTWKHIHKKSSYYGDVIESENSVNHLNEKSFKSEEITLPLRNKVKVSPPVLKINTVRKSQPQDEQSDNGQISKLISNNRNIKGKEKSIINIIFHDVNHQNNNPTIVPSGFKESSKWAQYVDEENRDNNEYENEIASDSGSSQGDNIEKIDLNKIGTVSSSKRNVHDLFSLCNDDKELDEVLNF